MPGAWQRQRIRPEEGPGDGAREEDVKSYIKHTAGAAPLEDDFLDTVPLLGFGRSSSVAGDVFLAAARDVLSLPDLRGFESADGSASCVDFRFAIV